MPILIAHRGNVEGPNLKWENHPDHIAEALVLGFDVEVDVWEAGVAYPYLGHDRPQYNTSSTFLCQKGLWLHCKSVASVRMVQHWGGRGPHYFFHENDPCVLTSKGYIWTFPGQELTDNSICVLPEIQEDIEVRLPVVAGICSDFIRRYEIK